MTLRVLAITAFIGAAAVTTASAQTNNNPFGIGTTLSAFGGGAADAGGAAPAAGLELGWEIVPHLAIEGATLWSAPGDGRHEFGVLIGPKFNLAHGQRRVPFLTVGAGMYRTTFDEAAAPVPQFYASRMADGTRTFDDFVASVGGGAEFFLHTHWAVRPDVRLLMVAGDSDRPWITTFGVHVAYHFEHHHITD
jgi:hypothetical protein